MTSADSSIEAFLHQVGVRLPGPAAAREEILAELDDGLREAADANQRAGHERERAIRDAVREFGPPDLLAAAFRAELMIARGRRTALALLATTSIVVALWLGAARSRDRTAAVHLFDSPVEHIAAGALIAALFALGAWTLITTGRAGRWTSVRPGNSLLAAAAMGALVLIGDFAALAGLTVRLAGFAGTLHTTVLAAAVAATCSSMLIAGRASRSCLALTKAPK